MENVLQELSEDFLTCCICLNLFTEPKQLPCLHSFCRGCLSDHIEAKDIGGIIAFPCPMCRKVVYPPTNEHADPADDFPDNFYIASLVSSVKKAGTVDKSIKTVLDYDNCPKHPTVPAEEYCKSKKIGVCSICRPSHASCKLNHLSLEAVTARISSMKLTVTTRTECLRESSKNLEDTLNDKPLKLRHRKEEILLEISQHFSDIKNIFAKYLLEKESDLCDKLKDLIKTEEQNVEEAVKEHEIISEACQKNTDRLNLLDQKGSFGVLECLESLEAETEKYSRDVARLESKSDVKSLQYKANTGFIDTMQNTKLGDIKIQMHLQPNDTPLSPSAPPPLMSPEARAYIPAGPLQSPVMFAPGHSESYRHPYAPQPIQYGAAASYLPPPYTPPSPYYSAASNYASNNPRLSPSSPPYDANVPLKHSRKKKHATASNNPDKLYLNRRSTSSHDQTLVHTLTLSYRLPSDKRDCKMAGITSVKKDIFVIVDRFNKNIKLINLRGPKVTCLNFSAGFEPWDTTLVLKAECNEIAVTIPGAKKIMFVNCNTELLGLALSHEVDTEVGYSSLGCVNAEKLVCGVCQPFGLPRVDIISMLGEILQMCSGIVEYPRSIDTSPDQIIAVSDWKAKKVILMNEKGEVIKTYAGTEDKSLAEPMGVSFYEENYFVVVDRQSGCLHKISDTGALDSVIKIEDNPSVVSCVPSSVYSIKSGLAVIVGKGDRIIVYDGRF